MNRQRFFSLQGLTVGAILVGLLTAGIISGGRTIFSNAGDESSPASTTAASADPGSTTTLGAAARSSSTPQERRDLTQGVVDDAAAKTNRLDVSSPTSLVQRTVTTLKTPPSTLPTSVVSTSTTTVAPCAVDRNYPHTGSSTVTVTNQTQPTRAIVLLMVLPDCSEVFANYPDPDTSPPKIVVSTGIGTRWIVRDARTNEQLKEFVVQRFEESVSV